MRAGAEMHPGYRTWTTQTREAPWAGPIWAEGLRSTLQR